MSAGLYSFVIQQGSTYKKTIVYKESNGNYYNLTNYNVRMQLRLTKDSPTFIWSGSSETTGMEITAPISGTIFYEITAAQTAAMTFAKAVYDIEIYSGSFVDRIIEGNVSLSKEVTR